VSSTPNVNKQKPQSIHHVSAEFFPAGQTETNIFSLANQMKNNHRLTTSWPQFTEISSFTPKHTRRNVQFHWNRIGLCKFRHFRPMATRHSPVHVIKAQSSPTGGTFACTKFFFKCQPAQPLRQFPRKLFFINSVKLAK
jgi:hypothetical protein